jgi:hypothetical protein
MIRLAIVFLLAFPIPALAQFKVVASCPNTVHFQSAGPGVGAAAVDVNGTLCTVTTSPTITRAAPPEPADQPEQYGVR